MNSGQKIGGFTLVEVLLATLIIVVATVPIMNAFFQGTRWTAESREMIMALNLAQMVLEKLYDKEYDELDASEVTEPISFDEYPQYKYQILVEDNGIEGIKRIKVTVYDADTMKELATLVTDRSDW
ncbi:hypothetical protein SAMN05660826_00749 [Caldanaerovirga acetigignens]|jgi:Tfp pilus assembly protein PilV|uniref:Prepilin-type N-terminal cleavage/methylation domain-containing protein n=1 Tax=Caldanaerovirga acetigignens TaxID=447595 RepID=A0A1M7HQL5_9FIRM|nr:hypothetical protein [Caldanaerovirga acetigignens]SHM30851.1 hypothetical protein SAMN05660826_00749 [Caldanaerovirga acetigignens]